MILTLFQVGGFKVPSIPIWTLAWIFLITGLLAIVVLIIYTKYGREISIKLSLLSIIVAAVFHIIPLILYKKKANFHIISKNI
jgi:hypothetical protein